MTTPACDAFQQAVFEAVDGAAILRDRPDLAGHHAACVSCQRWLETFMQGLEDARGLATVAAGVAARTGGRPCERARDLAGRAVDDPLAAMDRALVDGHLAVCADCREFVLTLEAVVATLPELAELDPGPVFTARVLAATSQRPARARDFAWWQRQWDALVRRPRFAIEAAYALTLCLVLVTGNPLSALEWTAARVEPVARERIAAGVDVLDQTIERRLGPIRDRLAERGAVVSASSTDGATWLDRARRLWEDAWSAIAERAARLAAAFVSMVQAVRQWGLDLLGRFQAAGVEPVEASMRSRD